jgi:hypothetical protein
LRLQLIAEGFVYKKTPAFREQMMVESLTIKFGGCSTKAKIIPSLTAKNTIRLITKGGFGECGTIVQNVFFTIFCSFLFFFFRPFSHNRQNRNNFFVAGLS